MHNFLSSEFLSKLIQWKSFNISFNSKINCKPTYYGNESNNNIRGSICDDSIYGYGGNDNLNGRAGDDFISGGNGDDTLEGEGGDDYIVTGLGIDLVDAGSGDDYITGQTNSEPGNGLDEINAGEGNDVVEYIDLYQRNPDGTGTYVPIQGGITAYGGNGNDKLTSKAGNNTLYGESGNDQLYTGFGNDILIGGTGMDYLNASPPMAVAVQEDILSANNNDGYADGFEDVFALSYAYYGYGKADYALITDFAVGEDKIELSGFSDNGGNRFYINSSYGYGDKYSTAILSSDNDLLAIVQNVSPDTLNGSDWWVAQ